MSKTDTSAEAVARHIDRCWLTDPEPDRTEALLRALAAERDALRAQVAEAEIDVSILTMKLSGNREEHFVRISRGGRTIETGRYDGPFLNRALYERDRLRHVLLGEPKPDLMDEKYADPVGSLTTRPTVEKAARELRHLWRTQGLDAMNKALRALAGEQGQ